MKAKKDVYIPDIYQQQAVDEATQFNLKPMYIGGGLIQLAINGKFPLIHANVYSVHEFMQTKYNKYL